MLNTWQGSDKYRFYKSLVSLDHRLEPTISSTRDQCSTDSATVPVRRKYIVCGCVFGCVGVWVGVGVGVGVGVVREGGGGDDGCGGYCW